MPRILACLTALFFAGAVPAQVAYVVAPEQAAAYNFALTMDDAVQAATEGCIHIGVEQGFAFEEMVETCALANACAYGDWAIMVSVGGAELHWAEFYCGLPTETVARGLGELVCDLEDRVELRYCELVQIYDRGRHVLPEE